MVDLILNKKQQKIYNHISGLVTNPDVISDIILIKDELIFSCYSSQKHKSYERFIEIRKIKNLEIIDLVKKTFPEYFI